MAAPYPLVGDYCDHVIVPCVDYYFYEQHVVVTSNVVCLLILLYVARQSGFEFDAILILARERKNGLISWRRLTFLIVAT